MQRSLLSKLNFISECELAWIMPKHSITSTYLPLSKSVMQISESPKDKSYRIQNLLSEGVLGFFALVSLFLGLVPAVFELTSGDRILLSIAEISIIALFAVEYGLGLKKASSRTLFIRNPWRILDALIILAGILSMMPAVTNLLGNSPALRLIRFGRLALVGTRTGTSLSIRSRGIQVVAEEIRKPLKSFALVAEPTLQFDPVPWPVVLDRIDSPQEDWLLVSNVTHHELGSIAKAFGVSEAILQSRLYNSSFPRMDRMEHYTTLFTWYPSLQEGDNQEIPTVSRMAILLIGSLQNVVVLTRGDTELSTELQKRLDDTDSEISPLVRATYALLKSIIRRYVRINEQLETTIMKIESDQAVLSDQVFLDRTFRLRGEITRVRSNLKHFSQVIRVLAEHPVAIKGFESAPRPVFSLLADDAENLYESIDDLMSTLIALVDFRLNVSSFQMNKVMRVLAVLTALTIIPAVTGGLLGMNVSGNPWSPTLPQVSFGVGVGMALCLYIFAVKGWMR